MLFIRGPLAQSVEQEPFKLRVVGSNPTRPTTFRISDLFKRRVGEPSLRLRRTTWITIAAAAFLFSRFFVRPDPKLTSLVGQKVTWVGTVVDDPGETSGGYTQFTLASHGTKAKVVTSNSHLQRGYRVSVTGKIEPGLGASPIAFGFGQIQVLSTRQSNLERWRQRFLAGMHTALPSPLAEFGLGLLIGTRALIPKSLQDQLALVGLSHLVAVSGYNLTIVVNAFRRFLGNRSKFIAAAISVWVIFGFLLVAGFSPSIVRAALVSGLILLAAYYGRQFKPMVLISLAAAATVAINPGYVKDLGWQLSFLAFFGILVLAPLVARRFNIQNPIALLVIESLAAQLMTFPLIAVAFKQISIIGPLANVLILPLVPLAMMLTFVAGLGAMLWPLWAGWIALPASLILTSMLGLINYFANINWAAQHRGLTMASLGVIYGLIVVITGLLWRRSRQSAELQMV